MKLKECFEFLAGRWTDELVVTSAGNCSEMWWAVTGDADRVFYLEASMSLASMFASGMALGLPKAAIWALSGDGAFCMNPGMLMVERQLDLSNLTHFLVSNRCYGSTSETGLPNADFNDYPAMARAMGLERVFAFESVDALQSGFEEAVLAPGHSFIVLEVEPVGEKIASPPMDGAEVKYRFGRHVERQTGVRIFGA